MNASEKELLRYHDDARMLRELGYRVDEDTWYRLPPWPHLRYDWDKREWVAYDQHHVDPLVVIRDFAEESKKGCLARIAAPNASAFERDIAKAYAAEYDFMLFEIARTISLRTRV